MPQILSMILWFLVGFIGANIFIYVIKTVLYDRKDRNLRKHIWGTDYAFDKEEIGCGQTRIWEDKKLLLQYDNHTGLVRTLLKKIEDLENKVNWVNEKVENKADKKVK